MIDMVVCFVLLLLYASRCHCCRGYTLRVVMVVIVVCYALFLLPLQPR